MFNRQVGIEIEFTGISRKCASEVISDYFNSSIYYKEIHLKDGTSYTKYTIKDRNGADWVIKRDRSVEAEQPNRGIFEDLDGDYKCELVTPVINLDNLTDLEHIMRLLTDAGAIVNNTCGLHIHIDNTNSKEDLLLMMKKFVEEQYDLMSKFNVKTNRIEKYCKLYDSSILEMLSKNCSEFETIEDVAKAIVYHLAPNDSLKSSHNGARYYAFNVHALFAHNTLEFRFFNATLDFIELLEVLNWVKNFVTSSTF